MNATEALRLADPARALPQEEVDEPLLREILRSPEAVSARPASPARPRLRTRGVLVTAATVVVVAAVSVGILHWADDRRSAPVAAPTPTVPFAADVPWGSAVLEPDGTTLHLLARWDAIAERFCTTTPTEQLVVDERADRVVITVRGFAKPAPPKLRCAYDKEPSTEPQTVHLSEPLGSRTLVDGSGGGSRTVLVEATVPTVQEVPDGFVATPLTWADDALPLDRAGAVRRWTRGSGGQQVELTLQVILLAPLPTAGQRFDGDPVVGEPVGEGQVRGRPATQYRMVADGRVQTTVRWESSRGERFSLWASAPVSRAITVDALEAIAQSVG